MNIYLILIYVEKKGTNNNNNKNNNNNYDYLFRFNINVICKIKSSMDIICLWASFMKFDEFSLTVYQLFILCFRCIHAYEKDTS